MMRSANAFSAGVFAGAIFCSAALLCGSASMAQSYATPRITANIDDTRLTALKGNVPRLARAEYDQGEADSSTQLTNMRLVLSRSSEQQAALDAYLAALQDKSSSNYHKWLTPAQFGKLYGPADSDVAAVVAWLESHGLKLEAVSAGSTNISFSGTISQVEGAFHTSIHSFQANGRQFYSNTTDPRIPTALTTVVKGVAHLNTIQPKPQFVPGKMGKFDPETGRLQPVTDSTAKVRPEFTYEDSYGYQNLYVVPADAATIYNTPNSFNLNNSSSTSYTGAGVTIGIAGASAIQTKYVTAYRSLFLGGDTTAPTVTNVDGVGTVSDYDTEAYLDTEISGGMAPGATIHFYTSSDLYSAIDRALSDNTVDILSLSFGGCEQDMSTSDNQQINSWWEEAAGLGIAVTVSTGDSGSAGCDYTTDSNGNTVTEATGGLQVNGLASTPYNIAVGGTDYYVLLDNFSTYATQATATSSTAGSSSTYYRTAKSYIPESTWNNSTYSDTTISANVPWTAYSSYSSYANIVAGSGGKSNCSTNTTTYSGSNTNVGNCTSGYSKPSWQTGTGVPSDGARDIPDISLLAANGWDGATWLVCYPWTSKGTTYQGCTKYSDGSFPFGGVGGTSASTPAFAGILALVEQKTGDRLGQAAQTLYELYNGSHASAIFHDVTVGNISVPCTSGTTNCKLNSAGYYFESGYDTTTGYDLATGLGSVDATALVTYWGAAGGSATATVTITSPSPNPVTTTESLSVLVTVTGSSSAETTPTGTVTLSGGGYTSSAETLVSGSYTFTVPAGSLTTGADTLTVTYSGDSTYAATTSKASIQVNGLVPSVKVTPSATSIYSNTAMTVTVAVTGSGATPSGTVTLAGGGYTSTGTLTSGSYTFTIPASTFTSTENVTLTATYSGDSVYASGYTGSASVAVTYFVLSTPTVTVTPASSTLSSNQSLSVVVAVTGSSSQETYPSGTVSLVATVSGSSISPYGMVGVTLVNGSYTFTIPANSFTSTETVTLTATYYGDAEYSQNTGTASVTVTASAFTLSATSPSASIAVGGSTTSTITVTPASGYEGTVTLSCALTNYPAGATYLPSCLFGSSSTTTVALSSSTTSEQATATITTTAATTSALATPKLPGKSRGIFGAAGGALLAFVVFLGIPARRRGWRSMLGVLVLLAALGSLSACCGGSSSSNNNTGTRGTTAGTYTFTVTGTGNDASATTKTANFTVTVNY
jgi:hypothetical protein